MRGRHLYILPPLLNEPQHATVPEDGNVNKVSVEMISKRSESLCLVLETTQT